MLGSKIENPLPRVWLGLLLVIAVADFSLAAERTRLEPVKKPEEGLRNSDSSFYDYDEDTFSKKNSSPILSGEYSPFLSTEVVGKTDDAGRELTSEEEAPVNATDSSFNGSLKKAYQRGTERTTVVKSDPELVQEDLTVREIDPVITTTTTTTIEEFGNREKISGNLKQVTEAIESFDVVSEAPDTRITTAKNQHQGLEKSFSTIANHGEEFEADGEEEDGNFEGQTSSEFAEATTPSSKSLIADRRNVSYTSHSSIERLDADPEPNGRRTISLASDTAVNHRVDSENDTGNFWRNSSESSSSNEPKNQVEVFGDSGHPAVLRISQGVDNETIVEGTTPYLVASRPKGRTIEISGDNEVTTKRVRSFETQTTPDPGAVRSFPKKSVSTEKPTELKPYPYSKSENRMTVDEESSTEISNRTEVTTEEISAYENTIGRKKAEDKIVVTEPSVLVDNSIQQLKPVHGKRSGNISRINSTFGDPAGVTVWSLSTTEEAGSRNASENGDYFESRTTATELGGRGQVDNNVPQGNWTNVSTSSERTPSTILSEVTENNIESVIVRVNGTEGQTITTSEATEKTNIASDASTTTIDEAKTDRQASMTKVERFNVTDEGQTEGYSVTKESLSTSTEESLWNVTEKVKHELDTTVSLVMRSSSTTEFAPEFSSEVSTVTQENNSEFSGSTTKPTKGIEPMQPTTVEYEFVGLTEIENSTASQSYLSNSSESGNAVTSSVEVFKTTKPEEMTERNIVTESGSTTSNSRNTETPEPENPASTITMNFEETTIGSSLPEITTPPTNNPTSEVTFGAETTDVYPDTTPSSTPLASDKTPDSRLDFTTSGTSDDPREITTTFMILTVPVTTQEATTVSSIEIIASSEGTTAVQNPVTATQGTTPLIEITSEASEFPVSTEDVTLFVRIIIEGSWTDVCPLLGNLRVALANLLTEGTNKSVSPRNIILHQTQCSVEIPPSTAVTPVLLYVVNDNGDFDYTMTELLPNLYKQSPFGFPLTIHSVEKLIQDIEQNNNAIAVVAVSAVAFICLVLLAGLLFIMRKRQTRFNYGERCRPVSLDSYRVDSVSAYNSVRRKDLARASKRSYGNPAFEDSSVTPTHPLNFAGLSSFCNDLNAITEEFSGIPQVSARIDELPAGAEAKNRYANVVPLPETRVPLQKINNEPLTEYINASYVRGPKNATKYYIACQAPIESTVADFWRMVWEQQSKVIIMLTDIIENGVEKCVDYIPPSEVTDCHRLYGDYQVTLKKHEAKEKYAISTLHLKNLENSTYREVSHIWYLWPTNGVPSDATGLIAILLEARALQRGAPGPIVVHCSPGTGRTGTLIALDLGIRQYEITRTVDVPRVVYTIRRDRAGAVQTKEQYAFIYKALNLYAAKLAGGALESM